jgi:hypothetical protein
MWIALAVTFLGLVPAWLSPPSAARAQAETAYDLISTVNALRTSLGLAAYTIDPWLMTYAQQHVDYIDSLNTGTHEHSDGTLPWDSGIQENVAGGTTGYVTAYVVVHQIWVDEGHRKVVTGYASGSIGAGVAYSADNEQTYFVIDVRPAADAATLTPAPPVFIPLLTSTPRPDGWIVHIVAEGQTLWSIAISYGTTVNAIRELNGIPADSTFVYVGQELKIIQGDAIPTALPANATYAALQSTTTATHLAPSATPSPTLTPSPLPSLTPTATSTSLLDRLPANRVTGAYILLVVGLVGLFLVIRFCFIGPRRR